MRHARTLLAVSYACFGALVALRVPAVSTDSTTVDDLTTAAFVGFVVFGWVSAPFAARSRRPGLIVAAAVPIVLSLLVVTWFLTGDWQ